MSRRLDGLVLEQTQQKERKMSVLCGFMRDFKLASAEADPILSDFNIKLQMALVIGKYHEELKRQF